LIEQLDRKYQERGRGKNDQEVITGNPDVKTPNSKRKFSKIDSNYRNMCSNGSDLMYTTVDGKLFRKDLHLLNADRTVENKRDICKKVKITFFKMAKFDERYLLVGYHDGTVQIYLVNPDSIDKMIEQVAPSGEPITNMFLVNKKKLHRPHQRAYFGYTTKTTLTEMILEEDERAPILKYKKKKKETIEVSTRETQIFGKV
jgi:hypothetical protein